jgi:high-affinity iron transporter
VLEFVEGVERSGGADPTALPPGHRLSHTTVVINAAILVLREGLETILVLAAVMASFLGANRVASSMSRPRPGCSR